jgi:hypothetical protein
MLAIHTGSLQACIIKYMQGVRLLAVEYASHPHGVFARLHIKKYMRGVRLLAVEYAIHPHGVLASLHIMQAPTSCIFDYAVDNKICRKWDCVH